MADELEYSAKTPKKPQRSILKGAADGVPFSATNQPSPEAKKEGWEKVRQRRLLTQKMLKHLLGDDLNDEKNLDKYIKAIVKLAENGNPKAIETVNQCLEDDIKKVHISGGLTNTVEYDMSKLDTNTLKNLVNAATTNQSS